MTGFRRINLEILGNTDDLLHAHVWPRYDWEPPQLVTKPVWLYPPEFWNLPTVQLGPQHDALRSTLARHLDLLSDHAEHSRGHVAIKPDCGLRNHEPFASG
jgi:hypothetical protein